MKIRKPFERTRLSQDFSGPSHVQQSMKDECDINKILAQYERTGVITHTAKGNPTYGDFLASADYQEGLNAILKANDMFMDLPAKVRKSFDNDPAKFLAFAQDEKNLPELQKLGLTNEDYDLKASISAAEQKSRKGSPVAESDASGANEGDDS